MKPEDLTQSLASGQVEHMASQDPSDTQLLVQYCHQWEIARLIGNQLSPAELCRNRPDLLPDLVRSIEILELLAGTKGSPQSPSMIGTPTIPGYDILSEIGRGGMGVVYKARQYELNRIVALKLVSNPDAHTTELLRFRQEAESIARLQHPNIVQIFETGVADGRPFLAIEYVDGVTLKQRTSGVAQPPYESARLLETIARAVHHAHECRIIHRDIKPQNILLTSTGVPKITDFGLARSLDAGEGLTLTTDFLGTPAYAAPEQVLSRLDQIGPWTDVYAIGAVLYEQLTGHVPFQAESLQQLLRQVAEAEPTPIRRLVSSCPRDLQTICMKCLEKDPKKRYSTAAELADDLLRFQADEPIHARPSGPIERTLRWGRRNPSLALLMFAVGGLLLASAIGGGILSMHLATALDDARRDRDRVTNSERETRHHLAESYFAAARLALQRGNGRVAIQQLDSAAEAGLDTPSLRMLRVKALCAIHDVPRALDEVRTLSSRNDLGDLSGEVTLWKADLEIDTSQIDVDQGLRIIRLAQDRGLSVADQHYAQGLLAKTVPDAIQHFREAIRVDPTNPRTNAVYTMLLIVAGRYVEARERLVAAQLLFPDHPDFLLQQAIIAAFHRQPDVIKQQLALLRPRLDDTAYHQASATVRFCSDSTSFIADLEKVQCGDPSVNQITLMFSFVRSLDQMRAATQGRGTNLYLPFPPGLTVELARLTHDLPSASTLLLPANPKRLPHPLR